MVSAEAKRDLALAILGVQSSVDARLDRVIDRHVRRVLEAADGNVSLAADLLGINRRSLQRRKQRVRRARKAVRHG